MAVEDPQVVVVVVVVEETGSSVPRAVAVLNQVAVWYFDIGDPLAAEPGSQSPSVAGIGNSVRPAVMAAVAVRRIVQKGMAAKKKEVLAVLVMVDHRTRSARVLAYPAERS